MDAVDVLSLSLSLLLPLVLLSSLSPSRYFRSRGYLLNKTSSSNNSSSTVAVIVVDVTVTVAKENFTEADDIS